MNLLVDPRKGFDAYKDEDIVYNITGQMTVFPLCCSTGILRSLGAQPLNENMKPTFESKEAITCNSGVLESVEKAKTIHEIIKNADKYSRRIFYPVEVANWYALSLILLKATKGTDTGNVGGYSNYKAANITIADRLNEDKRNGKRFNSYNITYSCDHFMEYMDTLEDDLGEWFSSLPQDGAHGARTRLGVFTPNVPALQKFHDARLRQVRDHVLGTYELYSKGAEAKVADKVAKLW